MASPVIDDKLFYVFGTGAHSIMPAMELFLRAGGLCNVQGIFPPGVTDFNGSPKTERVTGFAPRIFVFVTANPTDEKLSLAFGDWPICHIVAKPISWKMLGKLVQEMTGVTGNEA